LECAANCAHDDSGLDTLWLVSFYDARDGLIFAVTGVLIKLRNQPAMRSFHGLLRIESQWYLKRTPAFRASARYCYALDGTIRDQFAFRWHDALFSHSGEAAQTARFRLHRAQPTACICHHRVGADGVAGQDFHVPENSKFGS